MTVVHRPPKRQRRAASERFPLGCKVQVYEDFGADERYASKIGTVVEHHDEPEPPTYPRGRVGVHLYIDELQHKVFGAKPPEVIWFKTNDLEKL